MSKWAKAALVTAVALTGCSGGPGSGGDMGTSPLTSGSGSSPLSGNFSSSTCEPTGDGMTYQVRHYSFSLTGAQSTWDRFSDPQCSTGSQLATLVMTGTAGPDLTGVVTSVPLGSIPIKVNIAQHTVTPTSAAGLAMVQNACPQFQWQTGVATTTDTGCGSLFGQTNDCPAEYDLMNASACGLTFGDRSHPLCSAATRPTSLSQQCVGLGTGYVSPDTDGGAGDGGGANGGGEGGGYAFIRPAPDHHHAITLAPGTSKALSFTWNDASGVAPSADLSVQSAGQLLLQVSSAGDHPFARARLDVVMLEPGVTYRLVLERGDHTVSLELQSATGDVVISARARLGGDGIDADDATIDVVLPEAPFRTAIVSDLR